MNLVLQHDAARHDSTAPAPTSLKAITFNRNFVCSTVIMIDPLCTMIVHEACPAVS